ncbi:MAG: hypothetical protein JWN30_1372, partial [Bacilli bacterium]|nr:hypothetical protein [Bacilli bacterium]
MKTSLAICSLGMVLSPAVASAAVNAQVVMDKTIVLPGKPGSGDVVTADPKNNKVYLAQKGNNSLIVIDTTSNTVAASIYGVIVGNGVTYSSDYIFAASEQEG